MLTQTMTLDLAPYQIRVNAIAPGYVPHEYINELGRSFNEIPLRRASRPEDIATAAFFLVSEDSSWMTGQIMTLDGGHSIALSNPP